MPIDVPLTRLRPLLHRQFGAFTTAQAAEHGVGSSELTRLVGRGLVASAYHGVHRCTLIPESWEQRAMAAQLASSPHTVLARWSAARVHGLVRQQATGIELVVPRGRNVRPRRPRPRTSTRLTSDDVVAIEPFRCVSVGFCLAELGASGQPRTVEPIASRAVADGRVSLAELQALADRFHDVPGVVALRQIVGAADAVEVGSRSAAESRFVRLVVGAGLPRPVVNLPVTDREGRQRLLDAAWPAYHVCAEIDVHPEHATTLGRRADGRRQNDLVPDWTPLRFDAHDLHHRPEEVVRQVRRALLAAGWRPDATGSA